MVIPCADCGGTLDWSLDRVGNQPILRSKCRHRNPGGPWHHEPVEIIRKPHGKAGLGLAQKGARLAPVDVSEI